MTARIVEIRGEPTHRAGERGGRELAARDGDGLRVQLLWDPIADAVSVEVEDLSGASGFHVAVARERALDAFYHPFAYAA
jgi:hypothetical protein